MVVISCDVRNDAYQLSDYSLVPEGGPVFYMIVSNSWLVHFNFWDFS